jgi:hypothetical protein
MIEMKLEKVYHAVARRVKYAKHDEGLPTRRAGLIVPIRGFAVQRGERFFRHVSET